jgi:hypothetical protein
MSLKRTTPAQRNLMGGKGRGYLAELTATELSNSTLAGKSTAGSRVVSVRDRSTTANDRR